MGRGRQKLSSLHALADLYGIVTAYAAAGGVRREGSTESLLAVLGRLGAPVTRLDEVTEALRSRRQELARRVLEPVIVAWDGGPVSPLLQLPKRQAQGPVNCVLHLEQGETRRFELHLDHLADESVVSVERAGYVRKRLPIPETVPCGYHRLSIELRTGIAEALVIVAPTRAFAPKGAGWRREWGVFLPLYSVASARNWGVGDFADLADFAGWTNGLGGGLVGSLPILAQFLDEPYEISPYSPVSRLAWNELYLRVEDVPEVTQSSAGRELLASSRLQGELNDLRRADLVDYRRVMALKRRVLEQAARALFESDSPRRESFLSHLAEHPRLDDYATFRAVAERLEVPWQDWPARLREGSVEPGDFDESAKRYHLFVQWVADEQLRMASARIGGSGLYLDLPLGVDARGYDVWRERESFAVGVAGGAPPDPAFPRGQNWGFVPLHPEGIRTTGYAYVRDFLRHQLRHAGALRIDHMPSFHRVFWIPPGRDPEAGVYVRYRHEELYAVFSLESHRHQAVLVGEDLGTVPPEVPCAMQRHGIHRMFVVEYEAQPDPSEALPPAPASSLACINTHDMPPFAAWFSGEDAAERLKLELITPDGAAQEERSRASIRESLVRFLRSEGLLSNAGDAAAVLRGLLMHLRDSPARFVLVNLEDLWSETRPQNVPSTTHESPNWRRKARYMLEEFTRMPDVLDVLREIASGFNRGDVSVGSGTRNRPMPDCEGGARIEPVNSTAKVIERLDSEERTFAT